jgi:UDP-N-acetylmuramate: L-alanyl-gamma-D-glutamyl-meso-diaminopimelate ligase
VAATTGGTRSRRWRRRGVGVPVAEGLRALAAFRGVADGTARPRSRHAVYDDFAHHPTAFAETIDGLRRAEAHGRIVAVLEPRSNTMSSAR